jgi:hypothetical protein
MPIIDEYTMNIQVNTASFNLIETTEYYRVINQVIMP